MKPFTKELIVPASLLDEKLSVTAADLNKPRPTLYLAVLLTWVAAILWFHPRLASLMDMAEGPLTWISLAFFIGFVEFAWLYGLYNMGIITFALIYRHSKKAPLPPPIENDPMAPAVALLYTTCNDFVEASAESCVNQDYPNYTVYLLDDSSDPIFQVRVDAFAERYPERVQVVRRPDRKAYKAGNLNHGLAEVATEEPYFAIADADEILPPDFLKRLVPVMEADPSTGFVQANHRANPEDKSKLAQAMGVGIDSHWRWYQPLRNRYGFVMFLGHGALLRRSCWEEVGGFPDIVSEDLGFAIRLRERGYRGRFVEEVLCYEDFPDSVRSFRVRHMKWTRGTCEFLAKEAKRLITSPAITWQEKLDILFPTMNLPLTLLYFMFMVNANLMLPLLFGQVQSLTFSMGGEEWAIPIFSLSSGFQAIFTPDFFLMTMLTFFAPVMCFVLDMALRPVKLLRFLCHSTALYAALGPLSSVGVFSFMVTGKATFLVTGDRSGGEKNSNAQNPLSFGKKMRATWKELVGRSHPDQHLIQSFEILVGLFFALVCLALFQVSFFGLCLGFMLLPVLHHLSWENRWMKVLVYLPFLFILLGVGIGAMSAFGMQTVFFGYGFHF